MQSLLKTLVLLRVAVRHLGECDQHGWWQRSCFSPQGHAFIAPVFGRVHQLARCIGVIQPASLAPDHDKQPPYTRVREVASLPYGSFHVPTLLCYPGERIGDYS